MHTKITRGIQVSVEWQYQDSQSQPAKNQFIFSYRVHIENKSPHTVQLLRRHWYIFDAVGIRREVEGDGVIGKQPILKPGDTYSYTSYCPLHSGMGSMHGNYTMLRLTDDSNFEVQVPEFGMYAPVLMN